MLQPLHWLNVLSESVQSMSFLKRRKASKWHLRVDSAARGREPGQSTLTLADGHLVPRAQLGTFTKQYLGRRKRTPEETDQALEELIRTHAIKEVAFAACVGEMSAAAISRILDMHFSIDVASLHGVTPYLQAFISVAQTRTEIFTLQDQSFAAAAVPVAEDLENQQLRPASVEALFEAWSIGRPSDRRLLEVGQILVQRAAKKIGTVLASFKSGLLRGAVNWASCKLALSYSRVLARLQASNELKIVLASNCMHWHCWAAWEPNEVRLQQWADTTSNNPFAHLLELEGPALSGDLQTSGCVWQDAIRNGVLLSWLERHDYPPAVGLLIGDNESLLTSFMNQFLDTVLLAVQRKQTPLLQYLIARDGLDLQPLAAWESVTAVLDARFITLLMSRSAEFPAGAVGTLIHGLNVLSGDDHDTVRGCLSSEISSCVTKAGQGLIETFRANLISERDWLEQAKRLWLLRATVASSVWLRSYLDVEIVNHCHSQAPDRMLLALHDLRHAVQVQDGAGDTLLATLLDLYIESFVVTGRSTNEDSTALPLALHKIWSSRPSGETREVVLAIARTEILDVQHRIQCIKSLENVDPGLASNLYSSLDAVQKGQYNMVGAFTNVLAVLYAASKNTECWRRLLVCVLNFHGIRVDDKQFTSLDYETYKRWILMLNEVAGGNVEDVCAAHRWIEELDSVKASLEALRKHPDAYRRGGYHLILAERDERRKTKIVAMLRCLEHQSSHQRVELMHQVVLSWRTADSASALNAVLAIAEATSDGFTWCQSLMKASHESRAVACVRLAIWLRMPDIEEDTRRALLNLGSVLHFEITNDHRPPQASLLAGKQDFAKRVAMLVAKTQQFEQTRMMLKRKEPIHTVAMVEELGLEQPRGVAALMTDLPHSLVSFVDATADDEVELQFPILDPDMNAVQRLAFGLKDTETLLVYLRVTDAGQIDGLHVRIQEAGMAEADATQRAWFSLTPCVDTLNCYGKTGRLAYVLGRGLWNMMQENNDVPIPRVYEIVQSFLRDSGSRCMVCRSSGGAQLHRPTYCTSASCIQTILRSNLDMRLQDVRNDGRAVDLLLTSVFAAAAIGNLSLLPDFPPNLNDPTKLHTLMNALPGTGTLAQSTDIGAQLRRVGRRAELLFSWLCNSYRGFLISATGKFKIPHMANIHQFLLVDGCPELEARFSKHNTAQPRDVLFHGTSMDRLYSILAQGLRVLSGTSLMKHGQAHGQGVYLTNNVGVAWSIAGGLASASSAAFFDPRPDFRNAAVVLGCEHAGNDNSNRGSNVHVVTDESRLMVRYIFVFQPGIAAPRAQDISGPMMSTFNYLRSTVSEAGAP